MKKIFAIVYILLISIIFIGCGKEPVLTGLLEYYIVYEGKTSEPISYHVERAPEDFVEFKSLTLEKLKIIDNKLVGLEAGFAAIEVTVKDSSIKEVIPVYVLSPYSYVSNSQGVTLSKYLGTPKEELIIPETVYVYDENGYEFKTVTGIGDYFYTESELDSKRIILPKTITSIGKYAFANNDSLEEVIIPFDSNITEFSEGLFSNTTNLITINIPNDLTTINESAFRGSNISELIIEDNEYFVYDNNLLIDFNTSSKSGIVIYANPLSEDFLVPDNVSMIAANVFYGHKNIKFIDLNGVEFIGKEAFMNSTLQEVSSEVDFEFDKDAFLNTPYYEHINN